MQEAKVKGMLAAPLEWAETDLDDDDGGGVSQVKN